MSAGKESEFNSNYDSEHIKPDQSLTALRMRTERHVTVALRGVLKPHYLTNVDDMDEKKFKEIAQEASALAEIAAKRNKVKPPANN